MTCTSKIFRVFVNHEKGRVLVSGKEKDLELLDQGWILEKEFSTWEAAYKYAREIADRLDYVLEWYIEEMVESKKKSRTCLVTCPSLN